MLKLLVFKKKRIEACNWRDNNKNEDVDPKQNKPKPYPNTHRRPIHLSAKTKSFFFFFLLLQQQQQHDPIHQINFIHWWY
ncbi:hypothetical protein QVD17_02211 [Tagetes erecta]|uniref:Uncharacterized protein n=1 Tax=Tagetes erecta TaxID=13708 RepID=A0AAD8LC07_TARER|nr:hypothetical protein QVD17_02211 [Tagetes erecta]